MTELLGSAKSALVAQRCFRIHQLKQLDTSLPDAEADPARAEVHRTLRAAARSALGDIDEALRRIEHDRYGRCPRCGETISMDRLQALPMATLCGRCQRATALVADVEAGNPSTGPASGRQWACSGAPGEILRDRDAVTVTP